MLARVHTLWALDAVSGNTAHLVIDLLEKGVDEGKLTLEDFLEHLRSEEEKWYHMLCLRIFTALKVYNRIILIHNIVQNKVF